MVVDFILDAEHTGSPRIQGLSEQLRWTRSVILCRHVDSVMAAAVATHACVQCAVS